MLVDVALTAQEINTSNVLDKSVVVIDALRATSTMITALVNGCTEVVPVREPEEARPLALSEGVLFGGERKGVKISGFDLGNSPLEYAAEIVSGKKLIFCTTNGTLAIVNSQGAKNLALGAFLNAQAVAEYLAQQGDAILLACAGTRGEFTLEDFLAAGLVIHELKKLRPDFALKDKAIAAEAVYLQYQEDLYKALLTGKHARDLVELGFESDVAYCAKANCFSAVPIYREGRIVLCKF